MFSVGPRVLPSQSRDNAGVGPLEGEAVPHYSPLIFILTRAPHRLSVAGEIYLTEAEAQESIPFVVENR